MFDVKPTKNLYSLWKVHCENVSISPIFFKFVILLKLSPPCKRNSTKMFPGGFPTSVTHLWTLVVCSPLKSAIWSALSLKVANPIGSA